MATHTAYFINGAMFLANVALYAMHFARARRSNRRTAIIRRVLQLPEVR